MKYGERELVNVESRGVGLVTEIYDDLYLITFFDKDQVLQENDYGYYLEEEVGENINSFLMKAIKKGLL